MLRRYANSSRHSLAALLACAAMLLCACGSSPTQSLPSTATATATAAQPETPQEAKSQAVTTA
ncbi:MAG TPA: hypothetical protein VFS47_08250, partial [Steroidobacteraceae bacterium]|nr:hypothetical protein [Steroidobacteraceae bacterium]